MDNLNIQLPYDQGPHSPVSAPELRMNVCDHSQEPCLQKLELGRASICLWECVSGNGDCTMQQCVAPWGYSHVHVPQRWAGDRGQAHRIVVSTVPENLLKTEISFCI